MMLQLNPTLPVETPRGAAFAHFLIDYGQEHHLLFVCFVNATGECWTFPAKEVKMQPNFTMGVRQCPSPP